MEQETKKTDRRVIKTKRAIRNAFAELLAQKEIDEITVKDIADTADINRKTFYHYYRGVYQVVDEIENEVVNAFDEAIRDFDFKRDMEHPRALFEKLTAIVSRDLEFYGHLLSMNRNWRLVTKIALRLKTRITQSLAGKTGLDDDTLEIVASYSLSGMFAVYQSWFTSGRRQSMEELSEVIGRIWFSGMSGMMER